MAAVLPDDSLVEPLLAMVEDSKNFSVAGRAMETLGAFGTVKRKREKILETLAKTTERVKPGGQPRHGATSNESNPEGGLGSSQGGTAARWSVLSPILPKTLNKLTGRSYPTPDEWFIAVKENKGRLKGLFVEGESP